MNSPAKPTPLQIAQWCLSQGIVPLPVNGKAPILSGWTSFRPSGELLPQYFDGAPMNVGALLGEPSQWLVDIDLDWQLPEALVNAFLPSSWRFGRRDDLGQFLLRHVSMITSMEPFRDRFIGATLGSV